MKLVKNGQKDLHEHSGSNTHTFGRRSRAEGGEPEADNDQENNDEELEREQKQASSKNLTGASAHTQIKEGPQANEEEVISSSIYQKDVIDHQTAEQKKRLLYDKSLKAYYDPETGQYFEMKAQLISQASLAQLQPAAK